MKIITFMKMTGKFWSSFFYEQTLYNLLVKRENPYLKQKIKLLESLKNSNKLTQVNTPGSGESFTIMNKSLDMISTNINGTNNKKEENYVSYASYCSWFLNRFCKSFFVDEDAKQKRDLLAQTLGLNNYLLHLDFVDRQILLEQHTGEINAKIEEIINKDKDKDLSNSNIESSMDNTGNALQKEFKGLIEQENENKLDKPLTMQEK